MSPSPVTRATIAVRMGMPAATSAPKVNARMMMPAPRPIASLRRDFCAESWTPSTPPASVWIPAARAGSVAAMIRDASCGVTSPPLTFSRTWTRPVLPSSLSTTPRPPRTNGPVTLYTPGTARMRLTDSSTARFAAGSVSLPFLS